MSLLFNFTSSFQGPILSPCSNDTEVLQTTIGTDNYNCGRSSFLSVDLTEWRKIIYTKLCVNCDDLSLRIGIAALLYLRYCI